MPPESDSFHPNYDKQAVVAELLFDDIVAHLPPKSAIPQEPKLDISRPDQTDNQLITAGHAAVEGDITVLENTLKSSKIPVR